MSMLKPNVSPLSRLFILGSEIHQPDSGKKLSQHGRGIFRTGSPACSSTMAAPRLCLEY